MMEHFSRNLESSSALIVIGYGFQDSHINQLIEGHFLARGKTPLIVIDKHRPRIPAKLESGIIFYGGGVEGFDFASVMNSVA